MGKFKEEQQYLQTNVRVDSINQRLDDHLEGSWSERYSWRTFQILFTSQPTGGAMENFYGGIGVPATNTMLLGAPSPSLRPRSDPAEEPSGEIDLHGLDPDG